MDRRQRQVIDRAEARREGKRYSAFFQGHRARVTGEPIDACPYPEGEEADAWRSGWRYTEANR